MINKITKDLLNMNQEQVDNLLANRLADVQE